MEMKPNRSQVLMSEVLKGQVPELEGDIVDAIPADKHVVVVAERIVAGSRSAMVGILRGILLGVKPEIEFRCQLGEALEVLKTPALSFGNFLLTLGDEKSKDFIEVPIPGPWLVEAARIDEISVQDQLCTLGLHLTKQLR